YTIDARGLQTAGLTAEDNPQVRDWGAPGGGQSGGPSGAANGGSGNGGTGAGSGAGSGGTNSGTAGGPAVTGSGAGFLDAASAQVAASGNGRRAQLINSQESL